MTDGPVTKEFLERCLADGLSLDKIAELCGRHPSTVSYHLRRHGLEAVARSKHASKGGIPRETLELLIEEGVSITEMARRLNVVPNTVRYWLARHGLDAGRPMGAVRLHGHASETEATITSNCSRHGETVFARRGDGYYRCRRCSVEAVVRRRRKMRAILVQEAGGECVLCGHGGPALQFHHVDPTTKSFGLAARGLTYSLDRLRQEAAKCVLLCANCHGAVEAGSKDIPVHVLNANLRPKTA
jgi:DNA-binding CsgD family transcriptional regulator